jgi:drug/metabolite transporter (DMT)-like permease
MRKNSNAKKSYRGRIVLLACLLLKFNPSSAQTADGNAGITQATTLIGSYFDTGVNLMYAIGAVVGLVGAIKVYNKWSHGEHDTSKTAAAWFGACIFLVVVATVIKSFFGVA